VQNVDAFLLYYRPLRDAEKKPRKPKSLDHAWLASLTDADLCTAGFCRVRVHRFVPKRSHAVIRELQSATDYVVALFAVNQLARSPPSVVYFQTAPSDGGVNKRILSRQRPVGLSLCNCLGTLAVCVTRALLNTLLFLYIIISAVLLVVYRDTVYSDVCYLVSGMELSESVCPASQIESLEEVPQVTNESFFLWLFNAFSDQYRSLVSS